MQVRQVHLLLTIFGIGFTGLLYQLYSIQVLFLFFVTNTHAVALAISSFLAGLACSSLCFSRLVRSRQPSLLLGVMSLAACAYGCLLLRHYDYIPLWSDMVRHHLSDATLIALIRYGIMWLYLFFPALFLGGAFPIVNGLYLRAKHSAMHDTGTVYFWDTLGAICGALLAGFWLLPHWGLTPTVLFAAALNAMIGIAWLPRYRVLALAIVIGLVVPVLRSADTASHFILSEAGHPIPETETEPDAMTQRFGTVLFQRESPFGRVTVGEIGGTKELFVNYRSMCESEGASERALAQGALQRATPDAVLLNIGLGCGMTASQLARDAQTKRLDIVEINPTVAEAAALFERENHGVLQASNAHLYLEDGAEWLRTSEQRYDAIVIDVEEVSVIYSSPLYTREYMARARDRLTPDGILSLWSFQISPEFTRVLYNTLHAVFPNVVIVSHEGRYLHCYASMMPLHIPAESEASAQFRREVLNLETDEVNTLENRALEKYYNSNQTFGLPSYYREEFVR